MEERDYTIAKRPLYREEIRETLVRAIVSGELEPGSRIVETRWAKRLGVSQSPIREAIRELEMIGLVENIPYKGSFVRKMGKKDVLDTFRIRIALESMAIVDAIRLKNDDVLVGIRETLDRMIASAKEDDVESFVREDAEFHERMVGCSDNTLLKRLWKQCYIWDNTLVTMKFTGYSIQELAKRHELLYEAIEKGDEDLAREAVREHFHMLMEEMELREE